MGEIMQFPETVEEFMQQYKIVDTQQVYTNGTELVPIFRMKQWFEAHKQRWTPISGGNPKEKGCYLTTVKHWVDGKPVVREAYWNGTDWLSCDKRREITPRVTQWMPLPEPPEEGGNKNAAD